MNKEEILKILSSYDLTEDEREYLYLQLYFTEELNNQADEQILELHKEQKENRDSILNEIAKIMLSYPISDSIMSIGSSDKVKLKSQLNTLIQNKIQSEVNSETSKTKDVLESTGKNKCDINNYINDIGMNANTDIKSVENEILDDIINDKVENKTWTDRLWDNKNDLQKDLKGEIDNFLNGRTTVNEIEEKIKKKYNSNAYETKRLVHTEVARVQEESNQVWAKEHNVKYQMFMATLDYKTSERCRSLDGKVFEFADINKPIPPLHPFCRSTLVNTPNKDWRPSQRLNNETKEKVNWQTYEEWYMKNTVEARADKYITNVTEGEKIDTIQPKNIFKELNKSAIGKETIEYIENNNLNIEFRYRDVPEGVRGMCYGKKQIEIYIPNTKTKLLTTQTLIHEITHLKYDISHTQWAETVCFLKEKEHLKGTLTIKDKRDTIKLVKQLYPDLPWR